MYIFYLTSYSRALCSHMLLCFLCFHQTSPSSAFQNAVTTLTIVKPSESLFTEKHHVCTYWSWLHVWVGVAKSFCTSKFWSDSEIGLRLHYCLEYSLGVSITQTFFRVISVLQVCDKDPTKSKGLNLCWDEFFYHFLKSLSADSCKKNDSDKPLALLTLTEL